LLTPTAGAVSGENATEGADVPGKDGSCLGGIALLAGAIAGLGALPAGPAAADRPIVLAASGGQAGGSAHPAIPAHPRAPAHPGTYAVPSPHPGAAPAIPLPGPPGHPGFEPPEPGAVPWAAPVITPGTGRSPAAPARPAPPLPSIVAPFPVEPPPVVIAPAEPVPAEPAIELPKPAMVLPSGVPPDVAGRVEALRAAIRQMPDPPRESPQPSSQPTSPSPDTIGRNDGIGRMAGLAPRSSLADEPIPEPGWLEQLGSAAMTLVLVGTGGLLVTLIGLAVFGRRPVGMRPIGGHGIGSAVALHRHGDSPSIPDAQMCVEMCRTADGVFRQIALTLERIQSAPALRSAIMREAQTLEQRLATMLAIAPASADHWRRLRNRLQRILTELGRLKEITESAAASLAGERLATSTPRDRIEAFALLGVDPEVNEKILKKLVEALRMCWHPDLANGDADLARREERIKQINVAWDLITGKRQPG
jgi:hypothetical protein